MTILKRILFILVFCCYPLFASALDTSRYIPLEEVEPGMTGYALSVYEGTMIEKFPIKVISVVRDYRPGKDAIFVMGTNERFEHTGPVQGCSGSPVIIDGRIAGALAFGWSFVKDPLYGVTPIKEMLNISERVDAGNGRPGAIDFDPQNIDFASVCRQVANLITGPDQNGPMGLKPLGVPVVSSLGSDVCRKVEQMFDISLYSGAASAQAINTKPGSSVPNFESGSVISLPMVDGDIKMAAIGTVTDVVGDKVYAFGHAFEAAGEAELPMACGLIHMVVANQISSFKFGQSTQTIGTIVNDSSTGIYGQIGKMPPLIPFNITVSRSDALQTEKYECTLAKHRQYTPNLIQAAIAGAALSQADVPLEHTVRYSVVIGIEGFDDIIFSNTSSGQSIGDAIFETAGATAILMNNRFKDIDINRIDFSIDIREGESLSQITLVEADNVKVKAGENVNLDIHTRQRHSKENMHRTSFRIPADTKPGRYQILISGSELYHNFINSARQYEVMTDDIESLIKVLRRQLKPDKTGIYVYMRTSQDGISIGKSPLENLPASKMQILASPKRNYNVNPIFDWADSKIVTDNIVLGQHQINILVEKK
jgi:hypothetical protein